MRFLLVFMSLMFPVIAVGQHSHGQMNLETKKVAADVGLGNAHHKVSTKNAEAQRFFDQGLSYIYGFNHDEAVRSFKHAAELDPDLAMAFWGIALSRGSNYNVTADAEQLTEAYANLQKAISLATKASEADRAYIEALAKRYARDPDADRQKLAADYKGAMGELVKKYPNDLDAATLYAESMMNLRPWQLWSLDGKPAEGTLEIVAVLESVLKRDPRHPGANHYYIHAVEASPNPQRGMASARRLGLLAPKAGHLVHMPSHIYIRTGNYAEAAKSNSDAIIADRNYMQKTGAQGIYTMMYYNHNIHFLASVSTMDGRYAVAIKNSRFLKDNVLPFLGEMPMLQGFYVYPMITLVRFHKWDEILKEPQPDGSIKLGLLLNHFARGMAYAESQRSADAEKELAMFHGAVSSVPADQPWGNNVASVVLKVAEELLAGEIALSQGDKKAAIAMLRQAAASEAAVFYDEPPDWDLPVSEWLGRALLIDGQFPEAEKVYRAELVRHPRNGRALFGLAESLRKQGKAADARKAGLEFNKAWAKADTKLIVAALYR